MTFFTSPSILVLNSPSKFSHHFDPLNIIIPFFRSSASGISFVPSASCLWNSHILINNLLLLLSFVLHTSSPINFVDTHHKSCKSAHLTTFELCIITDAVSITFVSLYVYMCKCVH